MLENKIYLPYHFFKENTYFKQFFSRLIIKIKKKKITYIYLSTN